MARLNDPPPSVESVDALKRRFVRQNRELAKNNSAQSVRIRALECEQARILSENLSLRSHIIQLETDLDAARRQRLPDNVKHKLEAKVHELTVLIANLSVVKHGSPPTPGRRRRSRDLSEGGDKESNGTGGSRRVSLRPPGLGLENGEDVEGRLPTIREGKHYPRRTLETNEIRALLVSQASDSPDLGPPPVAHFQDALSPIEFNARGNEESDNVPNKKVMLQEDGEGEDELPAAISVNLETRRKRREGHRKSELGRTSEILSPPSSEDVGSGVATGLEEASTKALRTGAKRKMSAREDEAQEVIPTVPIEEFRFSRKTPSAGAGIPHRSKTEKDDRGTAPELSPGRRSRSAHERKILGNKSVNTDPTSPKKQAKPDLVKPIKDSSRPRITATRDRKAQSKNAEHSTAAEEPASATNNETFPKTPATALNDLLSPSISTAPSTTRPEPKDTPPPTSTIPSSGDANQGALAVRSTARRARAPVNYAEPNLVSKMRRPTKQMSDAVIRDGKRISSSTPAADGSVRSGSSEDLPQPSQQDEQPPATDQPERKMRTVIIRRDNSQRSGFSTTSTTSTSEGWKATSNPNQTATRGEHERDDASTSPLSKKTSSGPSLAPPARDTNTSTSRPASTASGPSAAISALISASSANGRSTAALSRTASTSSKSSAVKQATGDKDAEDPLAVFDFTDSSPAEGNGKGQAPQARSTRRHSSISQLRDPRTKVSAENGSVGSSSATAERNVEGTSGRNVEDAGVAAARGLRAERLATRRRSMML